MSKFLLFWILQFGILFFITLASLLIWKFWSFEPILRIFPLIFEFFKSKFYISLCCIVYMEKWSPLIPTIDCNDFIWIAEPTIVFNTRSNLILSEGPYKVPFLKQKTLKLSSLSFITIFSPITFDFAYSLIGFFWTFVY